MRLVGLYKKHFSLAKKYRYATPRYRDIVFVGVDYFPEIVRLFGVDIVRQKFLIVYGDNLSYVDKT